MTITCFVEAASPLGAPRATGGLSAQAAVVAPSVLSSAVVRAWHDFTGLLGDGATHYVMDLVTPGGPVRVPISSWQATQQLGSPGYVQCAVPAVVPYVDAINAATEMIISRRAELPSGAAVEYEMARAPVQTARFDGGPQRTTGSLSAYTPAAQADAAALPRALRAVRSDSWGAGGRRVRCAIDWFLRPGTVAVLPEGEQFVASYINYYVTTSASGVDAYMDVGERT